MYIIQWFLNLIRSAHGYSLLYWYNDANSIIFSAAKHFPRTLKICSSTLPYFLSISRSTGIKPAGQNTCTCAQKVLHLSFLHVTQRMESGRKSKQIDFRITTFIRRGHGWPWRCISLWSPRRRRSIEEDSTFRVPTFFSWWNSLIFPWLFQNFRPFSRHIRIINNIFTKYPLLTTQCVY